MNLREHDITVEHQMVILTKITSHIAYVCVKCHRYYMHTCLNIMYLHVI